MNEEDIRQELVQFLAFRDKTFFKKWDTQVATFNNISKNLVVFPVVKLIWSLKHIFRSQNYWMIHSIFSFTIREVFPVSPFRPHKFPYRPLPTRLIASKQRHIHVSLWPVKHPIPSYQRWKYRMLYSSVHRVDRIGDLEEISKLSSSHSQGRKSVPRNVSNQYDPECIKSFFLLWIFFPLIQYFNFEKFSFLHNISSETIYVKSLQL